MDEIGFLTASELGAAYRAKRLSPVEVTTHLLDRIERLEPSLNAFCLVDGEAALADARAAEARFHRGQTLGAADGIPVAVKDVIITRGWPTLRGSRTVDPKGPWDEDAPSVARLREEGAVLMGKTTTPEFGWKATCDSPLTGITRNPWNPALTPGASSGGAGAALAAGLVTWAHGTDGGGSIRIPAALTGTVGLKPTFGRVPAHPLSPFGTVAHIGPMARSVADAALFLDIIARPDARDWYSRPDTPPQTAPTLDAGIKGLTIAYSPDLGYAQVAGEVAALVEQSLAAFQEAGATVIRKSPGFGDPAAVWEMLWEAGAAKLLGGLGPEKRALLDPGLDATVTRGLSHTLMDYLGAIKARESLGVLMAHFMTGIDLLITPAVAVPAFPVGQMAPDGAESWLGWSPFSYPFNLTQQPAISIPCGLTKAGLPVGLQIVGRRFEDGLVLQAARAFEIRRPFTARPAMAV